MKFSINYFFSKCDQIRKKLRIWLHLPKKSLMENFIFLCSDRIFNKPLFFGTKLKNYIAINIYFDRCDNKLIIFQLQNTGPNEYDEENCNILNNFYSNAVKNLRILNFSETEPLADDISHPTLRTRMRCRNHSSISGNTYN